MSRIATLQTKLLDGVWSHAYYQYYYVEGRRGLCCEASTQRWT